jgi:hypothetical protein
VGSSDPVNELRAKRLVNPHDSQTGVYASGRCEQIVFPEGILTRSFSDSGSLVSEKSNVSHPPDGTHKP